MLVDGLKITPSYLEDVLKYTQHTQQRRIQQSCLREREGRGRERDREGGRGD
jgi:hypothetical protein